MTDQAVHRRIDEILAMQRARVSAMQKHGDFLDYAALSPLIIGVCGGDGIGPAITAQSMRLLAHLLRNDIAAGKIELRNIEGLTIENRAAAGKAIPDDVLNALKACHVILKGPTTTPQAGDPWPNIESANVAMRKELDLFANVRPVKVPEQGIDWVFFRENTEGSYAVGSLGIHADDDIALDFCVTTTGGTERIARLAFEHARKTGRKRVSAVTKANVVKTTDGKFLKICNEIAKDYPEIAFDEWYIDIMTAMLINAERRTSFEVFVLPNLYGDILTDEAAEFQGGVGTAGSANLGKRYAMFEAIHGSGLRMVKEGRTQYANPCSMLRASVMLLQHIGRVEEANVLEKALDHCMFEEKKLVITGRNTGATGAAFVDYIMENL